MNYKQDLAQRSQIEIMNQNPTSTQLICL